VTLWTVDANDAELRGYDLLIEAGLITQIGQSLPTPPNFGGTIVAGDGRYVTPGLVDMHSHVGVSSFPSSVGLEDTNEMTDPTTSMVRCGACACTFRCFYCLSCDSFTFCCFTFCFWEFFFF
jgi:imidazolonepropionase-like amidohydrolase